MAEKDVPAIVEYLQLATSPVRSETVAWIVPNGNVPDGAAKPRDGGVVSARIVNSPAVVELSESPAAKAFAFTVVLALTTNAPL
jgi:hypothetical protein